jgi:uncharacterized membrane protein YfcA
VGLLVLTSLSPAQVAGTAIVTHVATGALGTAAYWRSGQLRVRSTRRAAGTLATVAVVGTPLGILANGAVSGSGFAVLLAVVVAVTGVLVLVRERGTRPAVGPLQTPVVASVGVVVAVAAGLFGIGGPMLSVPLLVLCGTPVLDALAAGQVQSVMIAAVGTIGYAAQSAIDWRLALVVGVPELAGVLIGWLAYRARRSHSAAALRARRHPDLPGALPRPTWLIRHRQHHGGPDVPIHDGLSVCAEAIDRNQLCLDRRRAASTPGRRRTTPSQPFARELRLCTGGVAGRAGTKPMV